MGVFELLWILFIVLKLLGVAFVATSWWIIILWPLLAYAVLFAIMAVFGLSFAGLFAIFNRRR